MNIIRNSVQCMGCLDNIESTHRHDLKHCSCGNVFVDGGHAYLRRGWRTPTDWHETSIAEDDEEEYGTDHWFNYGEPDGYLCCCTIGVDHYAPTN